MRFIYTLACVLLCASLSVAQSSTKRFAKIHNDKKYIITESLYEDGHKEQFITSVPLAETKKMKVKDPLSIMRNIDWDAQGATNVEAIETAFNNALSVAEGQLSLEEGSFSRISLASNFFSKKEGDQSLILVNKVIAALSSAEPFNNLIPLEATNSKINEHSAILANNILAKGYSSNENAADKIGYRNVEFSEHVKNDGIFLTNGENDIHLAHIHAIYNWIFADAHTGWYNRSLILNKHRNGGTKGLNDDFSTSGQEGYIGLGISSGDFIDSVILDPTFKKATTVVFQLVDPLQKSKYKFEIQEVNTGFETGIALRK